MDRLTWTTGEYGVQHGWAGKVALFTIAYRTVSSDPAHTLQSTLPGFNRRGQQWKHDDADALKAKAEKLLTAWLHACGMTTAN